MMFFRSARSVSKRSLSVKYLYPVIVLVCCFLLAIDSVVLVTPVFGMTCEADCGNGQSVSCSGDTCEAMNGAGCIAWQGGISQFESCAGLQPVE